MNTPFLQGETLTLESLEDFKRKLDNEHTTVSAKLDQGVRARQELQELKGKLMDDLEVSFSISTGPILDEDQQYE